MKKKIECRLNTADYRDRVYACWNGKNIGGTMGEPYEGKREILHVQGFSTPAGKLLPNDDLDLQLVWLHAVEMIGVRAVDAVTLGEFWLSTLSMNPNEYGIGMTNMKLGLLPPLSGDYRNRWKNSNGAWIRTEVWHAWHRAVRRLPPSMPLRMPRSTTAREREPMPRHLWRQCSRRRLRHRICGFALIWDCGRSPRIGVPISEMSWSPAPSI